MDQPTQAVPVKQSKEAAALLDALPGLVGALDRAIFDASGVKAPFVLLIFNNGGAMHATNIHPPIDAVRAVKELAAVWDDTLPEAHGGGDAAG